MNCIKKIVIISLSLFGIAFPQSGTLNTEKFQYLSPVPGSELVRPETNIIIRFGEAYSNAGISDTSLIRVAGELSGSHRGRLYLTSDSKTLIFLPDNPFTKNERVDVELSAGLKTVTGEDVGQLRFYFNISRGLPGSENSIVPFIHENNTDINRSVAAHSQIPVDSSLIFQPDFPKVYTTKTGTDKKFYFLAVNQGTANYLSIIDNDGIPVYHKKSSNGLYDFKIQPSGILTYYEDHKNIFYGMDSLYQIADSFYCGNGYSTDFHDIQVLQDGHSFLISYDPQPVNMNEIKAGGDTSAVVIGSIIQELNEERIVVWQWRSWDHFKITDADSALVDFYQHTIEYSHINSIDVVDKDRIMISSRILNEITMIDRNTGNISWRFGGLNNEFSGNSVKFQFQHDAHLIGNNKISLFDNANYKPDVNSRALVYKIDEGNKTAALENNVGHSPALNATNMGNVQYINNTFLVGWGNSGKNTYYMSAFDSAGTVLYSDSLKSKNSIYSYRAFKFGWRTKLITADRDSLLFPPAATQVFSADSLKITNNGPEPVVIKGVFYRNDAFHPSDTFPVEISAGESLWLHFNFQATDPGEIRDKIYIVAAKNDETISIPVILIGNPDATPVDDRIKNIPQEYILEQNYPNPFNPSTKISYSLPSESKVIIKIYNLLGEEVKTLVNRIESAGEHHVIWNGYNNSSGIYFYRIEALSGKGESKFSAARKMLLLK